MSTPGFRATGMKFEAMVSKAAEDSSFVSAGESYIKTAAGPHQRDRQSAGRRCQGRRLVRAAIAGRVRSIRVTDACKCRRPVNCCRSRATPFSTQPDNRLTIDPNGRTAGYFIGWRRLSGWPSIGRDRAFHHKPQRQTDLLSTIQRSYRALPRSRSSTIPMRGSFKVRSKARMLTPSAK